MKEPLLSLAPSELRELASAIRSERTDVTSALSIQHLIGSARAGAIADRLAELSRTGMSYQGLAACLEVAANASGMRVPLEDLVDLVTTGPEAGGAANRSTAVVVSELFRNAEESVLLAGYAIYQGQMVFRALADRMQERPTLKVEMFLNVPHKQGDTASPAARLAKFKSEFTSLQWPPGKKLPVVYGCDRLVDDQSAKVGSLHAKCVVVDSREVFVSSANFTEAAQERNIEVGLLVRSERVAERLQRFFRGLVDARTFFKF